MRARIVAAAALIVGVTACAGNQAENVVPRADLFGAWELDHAASDSLRAAPAAEPRQRGGGIRVGGRFPRRGQAPEVLRTMEEEAAEMRRVLDIWARGNERITLDATGGVVRLEYADSARLELVASGRKLKHDFRGFSDIETAAQWKEGGLEVVHEIGRIRLTETYARAPESPRLIVTMELKSRVPRPMLLRRIYTAAREESL